MTRSSSSIANHFKSKGSAATPEDTDKGQGASNLARVAQAKSLLAFADELQQSKGTDKVFLIGDFNSYAKEDPISVLYGAGYVNRSKAKNADGPPSTPTSSAAWSGSLDHVLANAGGATPWSPAPTSGTSTPSSPWRCEYSRYNYNVDRLLRSGPVPGQRPRPGGRRPRTCPSPRPASSSNFLGINDFHGRIDANT